MADEGGVPKGYVLLRVGGKHSGHREDEAQGQPQQIRVNRREHRRSFRRCCQARAGFRSGRAALISLNRQANRIRTNQVLTLSELTGSMLPLHGTPTH